jgi:hypothetical protein
MTVAVEFESKHHGGSSQPKFLHGWYAKKSLAIVIVYDYRGRIAMLVHNLQQ